MEPSREFAKRLKRIDRDLSAKFNSDIDRWGIYHNLPPIERIEERVTREGLELQGDLLRRGYVCTRRVCEEQIFRRLHEAALVFYVQEEDGGFAQLDNRVIKKLKKMDHNRRNRSIQDWKRYMDLRQAVVDSDRIRAQEDAYKQIDKDKVWKQMAAEALRGDPHLRSVHVEQPDKPSRISIAER